MGAVTIAAASPARQALTASSIASITAAAFRGSGLPGAALVFALVAIRLASRSAKIPASPTNFSGWSPILPPSSSNAASAVSGPIPDGSPMVMRIGSGLADLDIHAAPKVAHIAARHGGNLLVKQHVFDVLAGRHHIGGLHHDLLVTARDHFHARARDEGLGHFPRMGVGERLLDFGAEIAHPHIAQIHIDRAFKLVRHFGKRVAAAEAGTDIGGDLAGAVRHLL